MLDLRCRMGWHSWRFVFIDERPAEECRRCPKRRWCLMSGGPWWNPNRMPIVDAVVGGASKEDTWLFTDGFWRGWFWGGAIGLILFSIFICWWCL